MKVKIFEIRDQGTFFPAICTCLSGGNQQEAWLISRAGYGFPVFPGEYILFAHGNDVGRCKYDPFQWGDRTFHTAHQYIKENWDQLEGGEVIDVEFILGETEQPKKSERYWVPS
jgi:hypothetical protein